MLGYYSSLITRYSDPRYTYHINDNGNLVTDKT